MINIKRKYNRDRCCSSATYHVQPGYLPRPSTYAFITHYLTSLSREITYLLSLFIHRHFHVGIGLRRGISWIPYVRLDVRPLCRGHGGRPQGLLLREAENKTERQRLGFHPGCQSFTHTYRPAHHCPHC